MRPSGYEPDELPTAPPRNVSSILKTLTCVRLGRIMSPTSRTNAQCLYKIYCYFNPFLTSALVFGDCKYTHFFLFYKRFPEKLSELFLLRQKHAQVDAVTHNSVLPGHCIEITFSGVEFYSVTQAYMFAQIQSRRCSIVVIGH